MVAGVPSEQSERLLIASRTQPLGPSSHFSTSSQYQIMARGRGWFNGSHRQVGHRVPWNARGRADSGECHTDVPPSSPPASSALPKGLSLARVIGGVTARPRGADRGSPSSSSSQVEWNQLRARPETGVRCRRGIGRLARSRDAMQRLDFECPSTALRGHVSSRDSALCRCARAAGNALCRCVRAAGAG
jgi:hypothetical protein